MKKLGLEHHGASTYRVYELGPEDSVDSMSLGMLVNNRIPGFAPTIFTQTDNIKQIKCDVTGLVPADQYLLGAVNKKRLLGVFQGVVQAFSSAEDYMIDTKTIQLELSSIFAHVVTGETSLICVPVIREEGQEPDVRTFLKGILFSAQYDARENQDYVAKIMSYLNGMPIFSLREFKNLLDYLAMEPVLQPEQSAVQPEVTPAAEAFSPAERAEQAPAYAARAAEGVPGDIPEVPAANGGETANQISLFYLLQHYNKENAAVYKTQKEAKKTAKKEGKGKKKSGKKAEKSPAPQSFAVPGQPESSESAKAAKAAMAAGAAPVQPAPQAQSVQPPRPAQPMQPMQPVQPPVQPAQLVQPPVQPAQPIPHMQTVQPIQPAQLVQPAQPFSMPLAGMDADSKDTVYFPEVGGDETVLMGQDMPVQRLIPYLLRKRNGEKIPINKPVFRIGRDAEYNDYAIIENRYIGHSHCHILTRNGEYFLVDDNSKNRTKLNGEAIAAGAEMKLAHGYVIRMADEDFEFHIY